KVGEDADFVAEPRSFEAWHFARLYVVARRSWPSGHLASRSSPGHKLPALKRFQSRWTRSSIASRQPAEPLEQCLPVAGNRDRLHARLAAADDLDAGRRHAEPSGDEPLQRLVGGTFFRDGAHPGGEICRAVAFFRDADDLVGARVWRQADA